MRTSNTAAGTIRGEFNTITIQGERNTANDYDIQIVGKNPFGGASASNIIGFFSDTTIQAYVLPGGGAVFNEQGNNSDFRIEGDNNPYALFIDASSDNTKLGGSAVRGTTEGTNHLDIFNGTAPAGTLTNGISIYSNAGVPTVMDASGNANGLGQTSTPTYAGAIFTAPARLKGYTVATLPAGTQGDVAYVTDALAPTFLTAVVGGGAMVTPVFYDGTNWVSH